MPEFSTEDLEVSELPEREAMIIIVNGVVALGALGRFLGISAVLGPDTNNHNESLVEPD